MKLSDCATRSKKLEMTSPHETCWKLGRWTLLSGSDLLWHSFFQGSADKHDLCRSVAWALVVLIREKRVPIQLCTDENSQY